MVIEGLEHEQARVATDGLLRDQLAQITRVFAVESLRHRGAELLFRRIRYKHRRPSHRLHRDPMHTGRSAQRGDEQEMSEA